MTFAQRLALLDQATAGLKTHAGVIVAFGSMIAQAFHYNIDFSALFNDVQSGAATVGILGGTILAVVGRVAAAKRAATPAPAPSPTPETK